MPTTHFLKHNRAQKIPIGKYFPIASYTEEYKYFVTNLYCL